MNEMTQLKPKLSRLKLSGILATLDERLKEAQEGRWDYSRFLQTLFTDEVERRDLTNLARRLMRSGLDPQKTLESFDFNFNASVHEPAIKELATCTFIERRENIFLLGPSGVGKTHLGNAIGHEAIRRCHDVLCRRTHMLLKWIAAGEADGSVQRRLDQVLRYPLLILDDFGLEPLELQEQSFLYEIICERYEKASTIITSNRDFDEWQAVFSNPLMGSAAMDRLIHRALKFVIEGKSYRLNDFVKRNKSLTKKETK
jgi:DNA replication protein DnaC